MTDTFNILGVAAMDQVLGSMQRHGWFVPPPPQPPVAAVSLFSNPELCYRGNYTDTAKVH